MDLGVSSKVTSGGSFVLALIVLVKGKRELLRTSAHAVCTVDTGRTVSSDSRASLGIQSTDGGEEGRSLVRGQSGVSNAAEGGNHAGADVRVGDGWEVRGGGPGGVGGWACGGDGVAYDVGG